MKERKESVLEILHVIRGYSDRDGLAGNNMVNMNDVNFVINFVEELWSHKLGLMADITLLRNLYKRLLQEEK